MNKQRLVTVQKVALYLGHPWKYNHLYESNWSYEIIDGSGRGLFFRTDGKMFRVLGMFPRTRTKAYGSDYKTIGVSISRNPKDIAADIARRLLPHYLKTYDAAAQRYQEQQEKEQNLELMSQALQRVSGGWINNCGHGAKTIHFDNGSAEIWTNEDISLKLNRLTVEQAIQIIGLLNQSEEKL